MSIDRNAVRAWSQSQSKITSFEMRNEAQSERARRECARPSSKGALPADRRTHRKPHGGDSDPKGSCKTASRHPLSGMQKTIRTFSHLPPTRKI